VREINHFLRHHWFEIAGLFTLAVSLWIAFGPLRHRLPRFLTRLGKYSATLKLLGLSTLCWIALYKSVTDDEPSLALNWLLGWLGGMLLAGALYVLTRKQVYRPPQAPPPPSRLPARLASPSRRRGREG
jgi:hypothetical protein